MDARSRLANLNADRERLWLKASDYYCTMTAQDRHYAQENLAQWDKDHEAEIEQLETELEALT